MTHKETIETLAYIENVMRPLYDDTLTDDTLKYGREALNGGAVDADAIEEITEEKAVRNAIDRAEETLKRWKTLGDLRKISAAHWALGVAHLALKHDEAALEHLQICAEMAEANNDNTTRAWALGYHGLAKIALFENLRDEGKKEVETAKRILEEENNMLAACAINERMRSLTG